MPKNNIEPEALTHTANTLAEILLTDLPEKGPLRRLTAYAVIQKCLSILNQAGGESDMEGVANGYTLTSWVFGAVQRLRKAQPKPEKEKFEFEG